MMELDQLKSIDKTLCFSKTKTRKQLLLADNLNRTAIYGSQPHGGRNKATGGRSRNRFPYTPLHQCAGASGVRPHAAAVGAAPLRAANHADWCPGALKRCRAATFKMPRAIGDRALGPAFRVIPAIREVYRVSPFNIRDESRVSAAFFDLLGTFFSKSFDQVHIFSVPFCNV